MRFEPAEPSVGGPPPGQSEQYQSMFQALGHTLKAYRRAATDLTNGKYQALHDTTPPHMRGECDCLAIVCDDGVVLRWDKKVEDKPRIRIGRLEDEPNTLANVAPKLSEGFVQCAEDPTKFAIPPTAPHLRLVKTDAAGTTTEMLNQPIAVVLACPLRVEPTLDIRRPSPVVSALNEFTLGIEGEEFDAGAEPTGTGKRFVAVSRLRLSVGWEVLEVYPAYDSSRWNPDLAPGWAEVDLLAIAAQRNVIESTLRSLDPRSAARKEFAARLQEFRELLEGAEAPVQAFLEAHPELLRPSYARVWRRLALGDNVTDFVIKEPSGEYVLVEIEAPIRGLFRKDGQPREELIHAVNQISDWVEYIQDNLEHVRRDLGLTGMPANPRGLVVIGRSESLSDDNVAKLSTLRGMVPRLEILTYDELLATTMTTLQNLLGTLPDPRTTADVYYMPVE